MKTEIRKYYLPFILAVLIFGVGLFIGKGCQPNPAPGESSKYVARVLGKEARIDVLKQDAAVTHDTITKWKTRWQTAKTLTVSAPCLDTVKILIEVCDSLVNSQSRLICQQEGIIQAQDSVIQDWHAIHAQDSAAVSGLKKEVKKQKRQKRLFAGLAVLLGGITVLR